MLYDFLWSDPDPEPDPTKRESATLLSRELPPTFFFLGGGVLGSCHFWSAPALKTTTSWDRTLAPSVKSLIHDEFFVPDPVLPKKKFALRLRNTKKLFYPACHISFRKNVKGSQILK